MITEETQFMAKVKEVIQDYYENIGKVMGVNSDDIFIVWQCKTLQNWKAMASTYISDGRYFEITYNGDENELYLDVYVKEHNECIKFG